MNWLQRLFHKHIWVWFRLHYTCKILFHKHIWVWDWTEDPDDICFRLHYTCKICGAEKFSEWDHPS